MNCLLDINKLRNRYFAMRHGHSLANQQGIIVSLPQNGRENYGLSEQGQQQVADSLRLSEELDSNVIILSSDFKRARETANIACASFNCLAPVTDEPRLRERNFGDLELGSDSCYGEVWQHDKIDANSEFRGAESANQVMARVTALVIECEARYQDATLLLVSHGDALQLLQTAFAKLDASVHRSLEHLETAEIRQLYLTENDPL